MAALKLCLLTCFFLLISCSDNPQSLNSPFPMKSRLTVDLPDTESDVRVRFTERRADGTPYLTRTEYRNKESSLLTHHKNGAPAKFTRYYKPVDDQKPGTVKEIITYDESGEPVLSDTSYRSDGTLKRSGNRLNDGSYEINIYRLDGISVVGHQIFGKDGKLVIEESFQVDGSLASISKFVKHKFETTYFTGNKPSKKSHRDKMGDEDLWFYHEDGETVKLAVVLRATETIAKYYNNEGQLFQAREFWQDRMFLSVYNKDEKEIYRQRWDRAGGLDSNPEFILGALMFLDAQGNIERYIELRENGTPEMEVLVDTPDKYTVSMRTVREFDERGRLTSSFRQKGMDGSKGERKEHTARESLVLDKKYFDFPDPRGWPPRPIPPIALSDIDQDFEDWQW